MNKAVSGGVSQEAEISLVVPFELSDAVVNDLVSLLSHWSHRTGGNSFPAECFQAQLRTLFMDRFRNIRLFGNAVVQVEYVGTVFTNVHSTKHTIPAHMKSDTI